MNAPLPPSLPPSLCIYQGCKIDDMAFLGADLPRDRNGDGVTVRSFVECRTACRHQAS